MKNSTYISAFSLTLSFIFVLFFSGCSNPINNTSDFVPSIEEITSKNTRIAELEFYVWKLVPVGINPAVNKAYVDIYQGETFIETIGATDPDGKYIIKSQSLSQGNYTAYAYTIKDGYVDYYGYKNFYNSGASIRISIQVNHF